MFDEALGQFGGVGDGGGGEDELGRGSVKDSDALETAQNERVNSVAEYLLGQPLLADYLEEGLDRMGVSIEDAEGDVL